MKKFIAACEELNKEIDKRKAEYFVEFFRKSNPKLSKKFKELGMVHHFECGMSAYSRMRSSASILKSFNLDIRQTYRTIEDKNKLVFVWTTNTEEEVTTELT